MQLHSDEELAVKIHTIMARLQTMDTIFYDAQRQVLPEFFLNQGLKLCMKRMFPSYMHPFLRHKLNAGV